MAVKIDANVIADPSFLYGSPYVLGEHVFDEYALEASYPTAVWFMRR